MSRARRHLFRSAALALPLVASLGAVLPTVAAAQTVAPNSPPNAPSPSAQAAPSAAGAPQVEEVVVTAQKRVERLQDVPVSVQVVSGAALQNSGTMSLSTLTQNLPAVFVAQSGQGNRLSIRGIGSGDNSPLFDQSVATFIDSIYHGRSRSTESQFLDVDRVEVLKGPQTTYLGNNAIAGAFNVTTKDPSQAFGGFVRSFYNFNFNDHEFEGALNVPITDRLSVRIAGENTGGDGYINDLTGGGRIPKTHSNDGRVSVLWRPIDKLRINFKYEKESDHQLGAVPDELVSCPPPAAFPAGPAGFCKTALAANQNTSFGYERSSSPGQKIGYDSDEYTLNSSYDAGPVTFTSVTGFWRYAYVQNQDVDATPGQLFNATYHEHYSQFSQELRFASNPGTIEYLGGVYYQNDRLPGDTDYNYAFLTPTLQKSFPTLGTSLPFGQTDSYNQEENIVSGFGSVSWNITRQLKLTAGFRTSYVDKAALLDTTFGTAVAPYGGTTPLPTSALQTLANTVGTALKLGVAEARPVTRSDNHTSPTVNLEYHFTPDILLYAGYSNGFLAGGFNPGEHTGIAANLYYQPETVDAGSFGAKTQWLHRRLLLDVALFYDRYSDLQVSSSQTTGAAVNQSITNAGTALSQGIEVDSQYVFDRHWNTGLHLTILDSHYISYPNASPNSFETAAGVASVNLSDTPTRYAPAYSGDYTLAYNTPLLDSLNLSVAGDVFFSGRYNISNNNDPFLEQGAYAKLDMSATVGNKSQGWAVSLLLKNLNNELIKTFGTNLPSSLGSYLLVPEAPRSVSLQLRYDF